MTPKTWVKFESGGGFEFHPRHAHPPNLCHSRAGSPLLNDTGRVSFKRGDRPLLNDTHDAGELRKLDRLRISEFRYDGEWKDGKRHGQGKEFLQNGELLHAGTWVEGEFQG